MLLSINILRGGVRVKTILLLVLSILCLSLNSYAQKITVVDFRVDLSDLTANSTATQVLDQNGEKCALIRVQTTQKGFLFDVGSLGVQKVDDNHVGEIWIYVPYGVRHISIRHPELGSLSGYDFPIQIQKARTYILEITHDKIFVNKYDDSRKQTLHIKTFPNAELTINGALEVIDNTGEVNKILSFGTYTYKIEAVGFYPKEGQITIDNPDSQHELEVMDLRPIMGSFVFHTNALNPNVIVDGVNVTMNATFDPIKLQIGEHKLEISARGYHGQQLSFEVKENEVTDLNITLNTEAEFTINSNPNNISIWVNNQSLGKTPINKVFESGIYKVSAKAPRHKDFEENIFFDSADPVVNISLLRILNYKNQIYIMAGANIGSLLSFGGGLGAFISNINIEGAYYTGFINAYSEQIFWKAKDTDMPYPIVYSPNFMISGRLGYSFTIGRSFRITPQIGTNFLKLYASGRGQADGAYDMAGTFGVNFSCALINHLALFLDPEIAISGLFGQSPGYKSLSAVSQVINKWNGGFIIKAGLVSFF